MSLKRSMLASASAVPTGMEAERSNGNSVYEGVYGMSQFGMFDDGYSVEVVTEEDFLFGVDALHVQVGNYAR